MEYNIKKVALGVFFSALVFSGCNIGGDKEKEDDSGESGSQIEQTARKRGDAEVFAYDFELKRKRLAGGNLFTDPADESVFETKNLWNKSNVTFLPGADEDVLSYIPDDYYKGLVTIVGQEGMGSGFVFAENGREKYIMTNSHVVDQNTEFFYVLTYEGERLEADLTKNIDFGKDLAVLEVESDYLKPLKISSDSFYRNDIVVSVGSPAGEVNSVGYGKVLDSDFKTFIASPDGRMYYPQFSNLTSIISAPGNSGGPVFNRSGEVAGVLYAGNEEYSMLVDMFDTNERIEDFLDDKEFTVVDYGFDCVNITSREDFDFVRNYNSGRANQTFFCSVDNLKKDSLAEQFGIEEGDLIYQVWNTPIPSDENLRKDLFRSVQDSTYGLSEPVMINLYRYDSRQDKYVPDFAFIEFYDYEDLKSQLSDAEKDELNALEDLESKIEERFNELYEDLSDAEKQDLDKLIEIEERAREEVLAREGVTT